MKTASGRSGGSGCFWSGASCSPSGWRPPCSSWPTPGTSACSLCQLEAKPSYTGIPRAATLSPMVIVSSWSLVSFSTLSPGPRAALISGTFSAVVVLGLIFCKPKKGILRRSQPKEIGSNKSLRGSLAVSNPQNGIALGQSHYHIQPEDTVRIILIKKIEKDKNSREIAGEQFWGVEVLLAEGHRDLVLGGLIRSCDSDGDAQRVSDHMQRAPLWSAETSAWTDYLR